MKEIGSDFWEAEKKATKPNSHWWDDSKYNKLFFKSGRNAIKGLAQKLKAEGKTKILLPAYNCETVIEPFVEVGFYVSFYDDEKDFSIKIEKLKEVVGTTQPDIMFIQSYFGFNTLKDIGQEIKEFQPNLILIEDITQSLFSGYHNIEADYYVSSLRKFFTITDGGFIISRNELGGIYQKENDGSVVTAYNKAYQQKKKYFITGKEEDKEQFRRTFVEAKEILALNNKLEKISDTALEIFTNLDFDNISQKRKDNYEYLLEALQKKNSIETINLCYEEETVPLFFPLYVKADRKAFQVELARLGVYCPIIWPKPRQVTQTYNVAGYQYEHILCIPIDQRYNVEDMEYVSRKIL